MLKPKVSDLISSLVCSKHNFSLPVLLKNVCPFFDQIMVFLYEGVNFKNLYYIRSVWERAMDYVMYAVLLLLFTAHFSINL